MRPTDDEFLAALRATFRLEAEEHLQAIGAGLLALEGAGPAPAPEIIERVFRAAHSLKGAARAVDFAEIETRCERLEDTFAAWKRQQSPPLPADLEAALRVLDEISTPLSGLAAAAAAPAPQRPAAGNAPAPGATDSGGEAGPLLDRGAAAGHTIRISVAKLDAHLLASEDLLEARLISSHRQAELRDLAAGVTAWRKAWKAVEPHARALRRRYDGSGAEPHGALPAEARGLLEFVETNAERLGAAEVQLHRLARQTDHDGQALGRVVDDLLAGARTLLLLPFGTVSAQLPRLVRDLCRDLGKEADLEIEGDEIEIDRRILEAMKDPLIHLIRNALDHGIEAPDARRQAGKPGRGCIRLSVAPFNGGRIRLRLSDDGAGIDIEGVRRAAVDRHRLAPGEAPLLSEAAACAYVFEPEVSTSPVLTRVSGRGLGLAIVRERAEKLGGSVSVESRPGEGTVFTIVLPPTLATFRGLAIEAGQRLFVVPTGHVVRVLRAGPSDIRTVEGRETIAMSGHVLPFVPLVDVLGIPSAAETADRPALVLVLTAAGRQTALGIDAVLDEQEVLVKPLRPPLFRVRFASGATVLGTGEVAPILNVGDLLEGARTRGAAPRTAAAAPLTPRRSVLVAEDSITSRMLLKSILESEGYAVRTAVDGLEAFTLLRTQPVDVLVSDVEMPRMDGFALTARIRADPALARLPVILVTALESREDRERGVDAGADAYIVKGSFDQAELIDTIRRLA